jgi:hypothetical protein
LYRPHTGRWNLILPILWKAIPGFSPLEGTFRFAELTILDAALIVATPDGNLLTWKNNDNSGDPATDSLINGLVLPEDGTYHIKARSFLDVSAGAYTLIIEVEEE